MKSVLYIALLSLLITACFSACERLLEQPAVEALTGKDGAADIKQGYFIYAPIGKRACSDFLVCSVKAVT